MYAVGKYFGVAWSEHCASFYIQDVKPNLLGKCMILFGVPLCWVLGSIIPEVKYYKLWEGS